MKKSKPCFEPGAAGWEARTIPLCHAAPRIDRDLNLQQFDMNELAAVTTVLGYGYNSSTFCYLGLFFESLIGAKPKLKHVFVPELALRITWSELQSDESLFVDLNR